MEPTLLGLILDSSVIIEAERKHQTVEDLLTAIRQRFGEVEIAMSAVTVAERQRRRAFIDELKKHVPVQPVTEETGELAGTISGRQAMKGTTLPIDDLLIAASAMEQDYALATLNRRHFDKIPSLNVVAF